MNEPTLGMIQAERRHQEELNLAASKERAEKQRIELKRRELTRLAQGLEELNREIAASRELRKQLKANIGEMKILAESMADFATVEDLPIEEIQKHAELVRATVRKSVRLAPRADSFEAWVRNASPLEIVMAVLPDDRVARAA